MGGGNAQKTAMSRARNQAKADADKNAGGGVSIWLTLLLLFTIITIIIIKAKGMSERKGGNMAEAMAKAQGITNLIQYINSIQ